MRIALITDAWRPQVNGVVTTLEHTRECLQRLGHEVRLYTPAGHRSIACPTYPEIRLSLFPAGRLARELASFAPDAVHIATEGPLGLAARRLLRARGRRFTTSYHTQFPQYLRARLPLPLSLSYAWLRWFHGGAERVLVNTARVREELAARGFERLVLWGRGVDTSRFRPGPKHTSGWPRPVFAYAGRVAVEKNVEDFLRLELPGSKVVIGGGPALASMRARYPAVRYLGYRHGDDLAQQLAAADVFVFPSRTDTFGLVMLEAMACGVPVAAYPVTGPIDVVQDGVTGALDDDLRRAAIRALALDPVACRRHAEGCSWEAATAQFVSHLAV